MMGPAGAPINEGPSKRKNFLMPPMSLFETAIVFAIVGVLVLWFGIYLWRERRDR
jgi:hypothetical protein